MLAQIDVPTSIAELLNQYGAIVAAIVTFLVAFVLVYLVGRIVVVPLVQRGIIERGLDETIASVASDVVHAIAFVAAVAIAFAVAGFGTFLAAFATIGGALALALGFAAQDLLGNFVAGLFILKDEPFKVGDWIEWNEKAGRVEDIDLRVTRVRTFDNERITVPNSELANNALTNPVAYDKLRQRFVFGIGYDDDVEHAKDVILEEARAIDGVMDDPEPQIRVTELADSYVGLETRFWVADPERSDVVRVSSDLVENVKARLDAESIEMPYPYRELEGGIAIENAAELVESSDSGTATADS